MFPVMRRFEYWEPKQSILLGSWRGFRFIANCTKLPTHRSERSQRPNDLWRAVRKAGVGPVTTSKLLARKRPKLLPVIDSVVRDTLKHPARGDFWLTLRESLNDEGRLYKHLLHIRDKAGIEEGVSIIRCFDVVVWRIGKRDGHGRKRGKY